MNLLSTLNKNAILTGPVDSYCLVCDRLLRDEDECLSHIDIPVHSKNLNAAPILDKYNQDHIIKVKLGYYCIYCNVFLKTVTKVGLHVNEQDHKHLKIVRTFRWEGGILLAFDEVQIQEPAFHGIFGNSCLICSTDKIPDHLEAHMEKNNHILELIKNKCIFGHNYIYRMVDEDIFMCLICTKVYADSEISDHHNSIDHKNNYNKGVEMAIKYFNKSKRSKVEMKASKSEKVTNEPANKSKPVEAKVDKGITTSDEIIETTIKVKNNNKNISDSVVKSKPPFNGNLENSIDVNKNEIEHKEIAEDSTTLNIVETTIASEKQKVSSDQPKTEGKKKKKQEQETHSEIVDDKIKMENQNEMFKQNDIHIDFDMEIVYCERCDEDLVFDYKSLEDHLKDFHVQSFQDQDLDSEIIQFAYENYMRILEGRVYCKLCEEDVNTNLEDMRDHVNFYIHLDIVTNKTGYGPLTKTSAKEFFNTLVGVESSLTTEVVINNSLVVTLKSFHTVVDVNRDMSCAMCQQELKLRNGDAFMQHIATAEHKELLASCNVVTSVQNELIRELRPGVYHCGYCNISFASWFLSVSHISTPAHLSAKRHALWSLERSRPVARNTRPTQVASVGHATIA